MSNIQLFLSLAGFLVAILTWFRFDTNKRIDDQNASINQRFADLIAFINKRFDDQNALIGQQTAFINKRFDDLHKRFDDLKAPPKQAA